MLESLTWQAALAVSVDPAVSTLGALADAESRMLAVLDELGLTGLVTTVPGLSAVGEETEQSARRPVVGPG